MDGAHADQFAAALALSDLSPSIRRYFGGRLYATIVPLACLVHLVPEWTVSLVFPFKHLSSRKQHYFQA